MKTRTLRKKSPYWELFWSAFFPHFSAFGLNTGKCGKNADQNNSEYGHFLRSCIDNSIQWKPPSDLLKTAEYNKQHSSK